MPLTNTKSTLLAHLQARTAMLPQEPGVYLMKSEKGAILYVGKATNLRSRVRSYFNATESKSMALINKVHSIEHILTANTYEALLLEINLIKQWKPPYNIDLKDGKSYSVIRVTNEQYPRVFITRRIVKDGSQYYGPYVRAGQATKIMAVIEKLYPLRRCRGKIRTKEHPCLYYHIRQCASPCADKISLKEYRARVTAIKVILSGKSKKLEEQLTLQLEEQSKMQNYELAQNTRDQILALRALRAERTSIEVGAGSRDYIGYAVNNYRVIFVVFHSHEGTLAGSYQFETVQQGEIAEQLLEFIVQYYANTQILPAAIITPHQEIAAELMQYYHNQYSHTVWIGTPQKPRDYTLLRLAQKNANAELFTHLRKDEELDSLAELAHALHLPERPDHIEGFDIAHVGGTHTVASMVFFRNGVPERSSYRHYSLRTLHGAINDVEAMKEVIARRYTRQKNEGKALPQLIIVDGGIAQVNAAYSILSTLELQHIPVIGIAKRNEELFLPKNSNAIRMPYDSAALHLIQHVRDESHRFATTHRSHKQSTSLDNRLLHSIPNIGQKRAQVLLKRYGSLANIAATTWEQIAQETGIGANVAQVLVQHLRKKLPPNGSKVTN